jgi:hypothetical protein
MCVLLKYVFFDFDSDKTLTNRQNVLHFFSTLMANHGFHLVDAAEAPLEQAWDAAVQRGVRNTYLSLENVHNLRLTFGIYGAHWQRWYVLVYDSAVASPGSDNNLRTLVEACECVYNMLHPAYGYGLIALENYMVSAPGESELAALYDYNFFSPRLVEKLGRENVLSAPTWKTTTFDDGGMLLEMSLHPLLDRKTTKPNYQRAAEILGMEKFFQGGL